MDVYINQLDDREKQNEAIITSAQGKSHRFGGASYNDRMFRVFKTPFVN